MKAQAFNYNGNLVTVATSSVVSSEPLTERCKAVLNHFKDGYFSYHSVNDVDEYKVFDDVEWDGDDEADLEAAYKIALLYVGHILGVETFFETENPNYIYNVSELTESQIEKIEELFN